ncbi:MAG: DUF1906 domain-containing protein [Reyranella sp.]|uniref:DUF1906 domain-containing protein n=1 Tax=Reyranella sp. TaxID=1929291 RepID=UPI001AD4EF94|nr:DUF1906 domain-containing protein [Reyranella sp.]MBN9086096.1 DUF1906 domain-containing protein [Reyranella sp.]
MARDELLHDIPDSPGDAIIAAAGLDTDAICAPFASQIAGDHFDFVVRCYRPDSVSGLSKAEATALVAAGLSLAVVFEGVPGAKPAHYVAAQGPRDAAAALLQAERIGQPAGSAIYFPVDTDMLLDGVTNRALPYFTAIRDALAAAPVKYRVGVYGSGLVCETLKNRGLVDLTWLSGRTGWIGHADYADKADLLQVLPGMRICNGQLAVDRDYARAADFGQFSLS